MRHFLFNIQIYRLIYISRAIAETRVLHAKPFIFSKVNDRWLDDNIHIQIS